MTLTAPIQLTLTLPLPLLTPSLPQWYEWIREGRARYTGEARTRAFNNEVGLGVDLALALTLALPSPSRGLNPSPSPTAGTSLESHDEGL